MIFDINLCTYLVIPYLPYSREDKMGEFRSILTMRIIAKLIETAGVTKILTMDIHSLEIRGFFSIPVVNLSAVPVFVEVIKTEITDRSNLVAASPDLGSAKRCASIAENLDIPIVFIYKGKLINYCASRALLFRAR